MITGRHSGLFVGFITGMMHSASQLSVLAVRRVFEMQGGRVSASKSHSSSIHLLLSNAAQ